MCVKIVYLNLLRPLLLLLLLFIIIIIVVVIKYNKPHHHYKLYNIIDYIWDSNIDYTILYITV